MFCGGECQQWLHRYCAGLSAQVYKCISEKGATFFCYACYLDRHRREIDSLKEVVATEFAELRSASSMPEPFPRIPRHRRLLPQVSLCQQTGLLHHAPLQSLIAVTQERKFNVVLYGVEESPKGTLKSTRLGEDLNKTASVLSGVDQSSNSSSIKDIYRLGRYSAENRKPRPLLVKFIRATDANKALSKRGSSQGTTVVIKPDMSPQERKCE